MDRRTFLGCSASAFAVATVGTPSALAAPQQGGADAGLNALFDRIVEDRLDRSPQFATSLGFDKGARAAAKRRLDDVSTAARQQSLAATQKWLGELERFSTAGLTPAGALNREIVLYSLRQQTAAPERFGIDTAIRPYRIFQQGGAYFSVPDFLNDTHVVETREDADAYLARLAAFATVLDQDLAVQREQAARGFIAPDFALDLTLGQMRKLRGVVPASSSLVRSLADRAQGKGIAGDWGASASKIVETQVYPALDRQIALVTQLRGQTKPGAGVWRLKDGDALYATALEQATTTRFTPDEVHRMGLAQVAEISAQLDTILKANSMASGTVSQRLTALNREPTQLYPDTPAGREALIASLNGGARQMQARLPQAFATVSDAPLEIRAVPVEIQDGASNGYYKRAALDGSRPAIYFINLKDPADWPKYSLPALTYHEGVPGHHLQISISQQSKEIPLLRKLGFFGAYTEGWALYAEQLADELGAYQTPLERAGYLQSFLFRAARLVVDTGIHTKRWTREQATQYLVDTTGMAAPRSQREVERYSTQPGQACSYKVGHMAWTRARKTAETALGDRFDLKWFHEVLLSGAMPLTVMEELVAQRTRARRA
ncbi:DUF885 domain-containing protein [Sphingomonas xinjiangensis]|uniref:Uncharacterized protein (DUF885 family) n=1 Tax=Sphingomonas xinjiangensis TaxID=643568 RepID=A0A840YT39_9SPHN|nr:DUF885 family protein [Sphingomonas xinjiangensis]MBB5712844.1 uncharacterized protein (DUF885 family) [Sphingomonas xinjiangensis]